MITEMLCPTALIVNTFSDLTLLQVCYCTGWQFRSCQSELYLIHKQGALESLEEAWLSIRWRLTELFHATIPTTNICLESSLKTLRRKMAARKTSASVAWIKFKNIKWLLLICLCYVWQNWLDCFRKCKVRTSLWDGTDRWTVQNTLTDPQNTHLYDIAPLVTLSLIWNSFPSSRVSLSCIWASLLSCNWLFWQMGLWLVCGNQCLHCGTEQKISS